MAEIVDQEARSLALKAGEKADFALSRLDGHAKECLEMNREVRDEMHSMRGEGAERGRRIYKEIGWLRNQLWAFYAVASLGLIGWLSSRAFPID
jgi:hypothetical protein